MKKAAQRDWRASSSRVSVLLGWTDWAWLLAAFLASKPRRLRRRRFARRTKKDGGEE